MTYQEQPYYKEFQNLLGRLQKGVSNLKSENRDLTIENSDLISELRDVRQQLSESRKETDALRKELADMKAGALISPAGDSSQTPADRSDGGNGQNESSESLFNHLSENEKIALRQQITELISRIDTHLAKNSKQ